MARGVTERDILINRDAVLRAIAECDEVGRERFLRDHGFGKNRGYVVEHEGKEYDAKAVVGVAHGYASPHQQPLTGGDFHSSNATVRRPLERLGFKVFHRPRSTADARIEEEPRDDVRVEAASSQPGRYDTQNIVAEGCFVPRAELDQMVTRLRTKKNLILQGPPGTGKTWLAKRLGYSILGTNVPGEALRVVQFHPSLSYEDFVRGYRPGKNEKLELSDGIFLEAVRAALDEPDEAFVLVIEEINRGNPAQIFGEMLTLLEDTKRCREEALQLAYRHDPHERVFIPENLYIVGTMNVADRSLALVDLALRRRFAFFTLTPRLDAEWAAWCREKGRLEDDVVTVIRDRLLQVNVTISEDRSLGEQFQLGHSFVTPAEPVPEAWPWFRQIVETEIEPLLKEYWFDQPDKVRDARRSLLAPPVV
jgi:5-methylcytosine-specific restriction protein B